MTKTNGSETQSAVTLPQIERYKDIHRLIAGGKYPNTQTLAEKLDVSTSTISRDIDFLKEHDAPIAYCPKERGYYYTEEYESPYVPQLTPQEIFFLSSAKILLSHYKGTPLYKQAESTIDMLTSGSSDEKKSILRRIAVPPSPEIIMTPYTAEGVWPKITDALENNFILTFDYTGRWNKVKKERRVHPYQLLIDDGVCFLWGYDEKADKRWSGGCRLFNISRMERVLVTREPSDLPTDFEFEKRCGGGKFGAFCSHGTAQYVIEFYRDSRGYVKSCKWADGQQFTEDESRDCTVMTFTANQYNSILEWVLAQGDKAIPIAPPYFVKEWKAVVMRMMKNAGL